LRRQGQIDAWTWHEYRSKKQKTETEVETKKLDSILEELETVQDKIEKLNDEAAEETVKIEKKYIAKRIPVYKERASVIRKIPSFWKTAMMNHEVLVDCFSEEDKQVLDFLEDLDVENYSDNRDGYKITMKFKPNQWFKNSTHWKEFVFNGESEGTRMASSKVEWKDGQDLTNRDEDNQGFFSMWFHSQAPQDEVNSEDVEVAEIIKEEVWPNPMTFFLGLVEAPGVELSGDEEGEEEEGEEEGEE